MGRAGAGTAVSWGAAPAVPASADPVSRPPESTNPESPVAIPAAGGGQGAVAGHHGGRGPLKSSPAALPSGGTLPGPALASAMVYHPLGTRPDHVAGLPVRSARWWRANLGLVCPRRAEAAHSVRAFPHRSPWSSPSSATDAPPLPVYDYGDDYGSRLSVVDRVALLARTTTSPGAGKGNSPHGASAGCRPRCMSSFAGGVT